MMLPSLEDVGPRPKVRTRYPRLPGPGLLVPACPGTTRWQPFNG